MKRVLFLLTSIFLCLFLWAQKSMVLHLGTLGKEIFQISDTDTIRFKEGKVFIETKDKNLSYSIAEVDSATFDLGGKDTVFVTYQNNTAVIENPYGEELVTTSTDGANVTIVSHAGKKGIVYYLSGEASDGSFEFTPDKGYTLVFDNLSLSGKKAPIVLNKGLDDESYTANLHLRGKSTLSDSEENSLKAALYTKSKIKVDKDSTASEGELTIKGLKQHAINSSKRIELYGGKIAIVQAKGDGINADGLEVYGGNLTIEGTKSDGVDCSEVIYIAAGQVSVKLASDDAKALKCDSIITIEGGELVADITGKGSKAIKANVKTSFIAGSTQITLDAKEPCTDDPNDYRYNAGVTCDGEVEISGEALLVIKGEGVAAKAINCEKNVAISGGTLSVDLSGKHYDETAHHDTVSCMGIKCDGNLTITGGKSTINIGEAAMLAKGIKTKGDLTITDGELTVTVDGGYYITKSSNNNQQGGGGGWNPWGQTSSKPSYEYASAKAVKVEGNVSITGGDNKLTATQGKGLICDGTITLGKEGGDKDDYVLSIAAGSRKNETYTINGGAIEGNRTKAHGSPKGIKADKAVVINSGTVDIYAYDTGILAPEITINGGEIEVNAPYDQGVFGKQKLDILGGNLKVPASYEALSGAIITFGEGSSTYVVADDDAWNATDGKESSSAVHIYVNGGIHYAQCMGDGLDSNGDMIISGGITVVAQSHSLNSPLDTDTGWKHKGGFVFAVGGNGMFNESIPVESQGHIYSSDISLMADQYIVVANNAGQVLAAIKMPLNPTTNNKKSGAVCAYNNDVKSYQFYVGNSFNGAMDYFDGRFGLYTPAQNINLNGFTSYQVSTATGNGSAFGGGGGFQW